MPQVPQTFDALAVRAWCGLALDALGRAREEIDAINVYPVADGDTGTNLYLTLESAATAVEAVFAGHEAGGGGDPGPTLADAVRAMAHGALIGARGNSGTILAQLLRGMAQVLAGADAPAYADGTGLGLALRHAADSARQAVAHPVEGTVLTVASAAADAAAEAGGDCDAVARAAYEGARTALAETPDRLDVLRQAGVVDAGGRGLVTVLAALVETLTGEAPRGAAARGTGPHARVEAAHTVAAPCTDEDAVPGPEGPAFEVIYLLEAEDTAVARLRERLDTLGDSLVVVGGDGLWNVHVHVDDAGAAVEAGVEAGRPYRIRITRFGAGDAHAAGTERMPPSASSGRWWPWCPARAWPRCTPRPAPRPCSPGPGSRPRAANSSRPYGAPTRARWCCCPTTPNCATPPPRPPSRCARRASGWR